MSEQIKVTVVMTDEKQDTDSKGKNTGRILLTQDPFVTLMPVLLKNRLMEGNLCGGRGECGGCAVQFLEGAPLPTPLERKRFSAEELRRGYRLACMTKPRTDCTIRLLKNEREEVPVLTKTIPLSGNIDLMGRTIKQSENRISGDVEFVDMPADTTKNGDKNTTVILEDQAAVTDYMIAVDLGTTTIAMLLISMTEKEAVDTYCEHNPQRSYGADVLSRIQASCEGHREELQRLVCESLSRGLRHFLLYLNGKGSKSAYDRSVSAEGISAKGEQACAARLRCMCIAGNTAMEHLLMGYDVQSLGRSPFMPVKNGVQETTLIDLLSCLDTDTSAAGEILMQGGSLTQEAGLRTLPVYLTPGISAFVGGDVVAGLYAMRMLPGYAETITPRMEEKTAGYRKGSDALRMQDEEAADGNVETADGGVRFLIDLGTNGEMAITDGRRMLVTATAAGPAFEGGGESAFIGTDRIALVASLLRRGILDETGLLAEPYFSDGVPVEPVQNRIVSEPVQNRIASESARGGIAAAQSRGSTYFFCKEDIRALQMAKAAIRAGIEILWQEMGCPRVDRVYLAGGFGYELDVEAAFSIGLLPVRLRGRVQAVGNTSLAGAYLMGRALWEGRIDRGVLEERLSSETLVESVNLAKRKTFAALYLRYMNLEEN